MWGMVNQLQILIHLPLVGLDLPVKVSQYLNKFQSISDFDVVDIESLLSQIQLFDYDEETVTEEKYEDFGYQHLSVVRNLGFNIFFVMVLLFLIVIWSILQNFKGANIRYAFICTHTK